MTKPLPRVHSTNRDADYKPLHDWLDAALPKFRENYLGRAWPNFLAGRHDISGRAYETVCPFDCDLLIARLVSADKKAVKAAVTAARDAYPVWSGLGWRQRVRIMRKWAKTIERRKYDFAMASLYEVGKSRYEAIGEAEEAVDLVNGCCDEMERNEGFIRKVKRAHHREETVTALRSFGVFAVIAPFNFPVAVPCNMLAACLVTGNTAVFKPAPEAGLTGALLVETAEAAGLPAGVMNLLNGEEAGALLIDAPEVDGIAFTGSQAVGMRIVRKIASEPFARPVIAEMGGKNQTYVSASADLDVAAQAIVRSAFGLQGQTCSAGSVAFVDRNMAPALLAGLAKRAKELIIGSPEDRSVFLGPVIDQAAMDRYDKTVKAARAKGRIVYGGEKLRTGAFARGYFVEPLIVTGIPADHWINRDELFLPVLSIVAVENLEEAVALGDRSMCGMSARLYSRDDKEIEAFLARAEAGVLSVNRASGAATGGWSGYQSFCGWKGSGVDGRGASGMHALQRYMREQSRTILHS